MCVTCHYHARMAFRANEATADGRDRALRYLVPREADSTQRRQSENAVNEIIDRYGPVVESYPTWHPLVANHDSRNPVTTPRPESGYEGLDHTVFLRNGFITCPYHGEQNVIDSVKGLPDHPAAVVTAQRIDELLYHENAKPVFVRCDWDKPLETDGTIPKSLVVPLVLEQELPCWRWAQLAETWDTMKPYFLGTPHGSRSSLFVNQESGQALKKIWNALIYTGMFGPIKV